jgi:glycosyltransferase involved in cell wall biosynthesis
MPQPLVTVFLPVFNAQEFLPHWWEKNGDELRSVDAKLLIVDNGSTDLTLSCVDAFGYPNLEIVRHNTNLGLEASFMSAKKSITSKYRMLLPADDW